MIRPILVALLVLGLPGFAAAQSSHTDTQLWFDAGLQLRATKHVRINLSQELRVSARDAAIDSAMTELAPSYEPFKFLRIEAGYRFIYGKDGERDDFESWHRFFGGMNLRADIEPVRLEARFQYQEQIRFEGEDKHEHTARTRGRVTWLIDKTKLSGSFELFLRIANKEPIAAHKWRAFVGGSYRIGECDLGLTLGYESFFVQERAALIAGLSFEAQLDLDP